MALNLESNSTLKNHGLKSKRIICEFWVVGNEDPTKKGQGSDLPGIVVVRTESRTNQADKVEDVSNWIAFPYDSYQGGCCFGLLVNGNNFTSPIEKVYRISITTSETDQVRLEYVYGNWLTPQGNIAVEIFCDGLTLNTNKTIKFLLELELKLK